MKIIDYADREMLALDVADVIATELEQALLHEENVSFAVPGGTTPAPIFEALSGVKHVDWGRVNVLLTDERWVPSDHERSNERLVRSTLMQGFSAEATFLSVYEDAEMQDTLAQKSASLQEFAPISVLLLGMGADMHTASLFPNAVGLEAALSSSVAEYCVLTPDSQPEPRISLSAAAISGALSKHLVIFGSEKRQALETARKLQPNEAPIKVALSGLTVHWAE